MAAPSTESFANRVSAAGIVATPFVATLAMLAWIAPPSSAQRAAADPVIQALGTHALALTVVIATLVMAVWVAAARPSRAAVTHAFVMALAGAVAAALVCFVVRVAVGPVLPAFIPGEESARPGLAQGVAAGVLEEAVFRLGVLPATFLAVSRRSRPRNATVVAIAVTALSFAAVHQLGPGAGPFRLDYFLTRALIPGAAMSAVFFVLGPSFIITAHCMAHVFIPFLFHAQ